MEIVCGISKNTVASIGGLAPLGGKVYGVTLMAVAGGVWFMNCPSLSGKIIRSTREINGTFDEWPSISEHPNKYTKVRGLLFVNESK
jgi:hypothetical protein